MVDPYKMVLINSIASAFLLIGVLFYRFIYPKKKIPLAFLLFLILLLPCMSILRKGVYESGDFNIHIYRTMAFYQSLTEGNILPSWAGDLNSTYGYPLFIFNYTLPYYLIAFFHLIGFSFIASMKLFLAANIILSGVFMFLFTRILLKNETAAFVAAVFYTFAPYHLVDIHFKVVIGEILFFTLLPLTFLFFYKFYQQKTITLFILSSLSFAGLITSHIILAIFTAVIFCFFFIFTAWGNISKIFLFFGIFFLAAGISSYVWAGSLLMSAYSFIQNVQLGTVYFPTLQDLLFSPWRMGFLFQGPRGEISHALGYMHLFIITALLFLLWKGKIPQKIVREQIFWISMFFLFLFLVTPYSQFIWENIPIIKTTGSHRLLVLTTFISSFLAGYFILYIKTPTSIVFIVIITIGITLLNWGQRRVIPNITDQTLQQNLPKSTSQGEAHFYANTKWVDIKNPWFSKLPKDRLVILKGNGKIKEISRTSTKHVYVLDAYTLLKLQENTLFFPGWKATINGVEVPLSPSNKGIITFSVEKGLYQLDLSYHDIPSLTILKIISVSAFLFSIIILVIQLLLSKKRLPLFKNL